MAVVAGGLDIIYPPENAELHGAIAEQGLLLSECPLGFLPRGQDFPRRNRLISGLSLGVVVVEAAERSGSLITARMALEQGREVFAVPGHPLDPRATGTNALIRSGATLITAAADILEALPTPPYAANGLYEPDDLFLPFGLAAPSHTAALRPQDRAAVLEALGITPVSIDIIVRRTGLARARSPLRFWSWTSPDGSSGMASKACRCAGISMSWLESGAQTAAQKMLSLGGLA